MLSFKGLAARIVGRARAELEADLRARNHPEAAPIPMDDWLAQLDARAAAAIAAIEAAPPPDDDEEPDEDVRAFDYEDFDRRR